MVSIFHFLAPTRLYVVYVSGGIWEPKMSQLPNPSGRVSITAAIIGALGLIIAAWVGRTSGVATGTENTRETAAIEQATAVAQAGITQVVITQVVTQIAITQVVATAAVADTEPATTPTNLPPTPTSEPPTPTPTVAPIGTVLYEANWADRMGEWRGGSEWKVSGGMLVNDGTCCVSGRREFIIAPYSPNTDDYAIEAEIQLVRASDDARCRPEYGIASRMTDNREGYLAGIDLAIYNTACQPNLIVIKSPILSPPNSPDTLLANKEFTPDTGWHLYRVEVKGNMVRLLVDGATIFDAVVDNRYLDSGQVGLYATKVSFSVRSFKVIKL